MASPERSDAVRRVTVAVRVDGREPYAMFELVELTGSVARLRSPLLLEIGEQLELRLASGGRTVDVAGRIVAIDRAGDRAGDRGGGHDEPITTVELADADAVAPLLR